MTVVYVDRATWGARDPRRGRILDPANIRGVVVHHTVMPAPPAGDLPAISAYMRRLQTIRPDLGAEVPYSFVVFAGRNDSDGIVCEGRGWYRTGAHTEGLNSTRYGVAYGADTRLDPVTDGMVEGVRWVLDKIADPVPTTGHLDHKATACPGPGGVARLDDVQPGGLDLPDPTTRKQHDMETLIDTSTNEGWVVAGNRARKLSDVKGWRASWNGPTYESQSMRHVIGDLYDVVA